MVSFDIIKKKKNSKYDAFGRLGFLLLIVLFVSIFLWARQTVEVQKIV